MLFSRLRMNKILPLLLEGLLYSFEESFTRSCREGICGSCAMNINGENGLACLTKITPGRDTMTIRPLPHMFVIKDLVAGKWNSSIKIIK